MMKINVIYFLILATVAFVCSEADVYAQRKTKDLTIKVMSFNIRMNYKDDGPNNWQYRRDYMADLIHYYQPGLLGTEESYYPQYVDLKERLTDYGSFGPVEGRQGAESVAIFYQKEKYRLIDSGTFWLSQTPEKQSLGWDAALRRTVTWGEFRLKANNRKIFFFVTHFDHKGAIAREESAKLLLSKVHEIAGKANAFIVGDFNLREESLYYNLLTSGTDAIAPFYDTYKLAKKPYGPTWTLQDFGQMPVDKRPRIDYIFSNKNVSVAGYINIADQRGDVYPSDHNPQMATINLK